MSNPDPYLRPGLTPPTDVELYASEAAGGGTTTPVAVSATAIGVASVSTQSAYVRSAAVTATGDAAVAFEFIPGASPPPQPSPGGAVYSQVVLRHSVHVGVIARCTAHVDVEPIYAGRRAREDELLLVGAF